MFFSNHLAALRLAVLPILSVFTTFAQQDFNHYQTLVCKGPIPEDFVLSTATKVTNDIAVKNTGLTPTKERVFFESIHYAIDPILHSGAVIYGDDITTYVEAVAANLLQDEHELKRQLRFYTIKSNATNAFSTDQGIVFVTTGLISQLTSEAQLAYVLSHEIAHYTEKHVIERFNEKTKSRITARQLEKMSYHSRENELAADSIALRLYHDAGYSDEEIISTFDVLMYSYLPFDELEVPQDYFLTEQLYIPETYFPSKKYPITAEEDYDDRRSSHPNIKKRKAAVTDHITAYDNWKKVVYTQGENQFIYVRNLARFESVRTSVMDARYGDALYAIFLLERQFPESVYLQQMKAQTWLGLLQATDHDYLPAVTDYEGEISSVYFFLKKLKTDAMKTVAVRNIYDIQKKFPEDRMLALVKGKMVKKLAETEKFDWANYSRWNFHTAAALSLAKSDSLRNVAASENAGEAQKSKYERIKQKKNINVPENFDSTAFYLYGLSDISADSTFMADYTILHKTYLEQKKAQEELDLMNAKKRKRKKSELISPVDLQKVIVVQPGASCYTKTGNSQWKRAENQQKFATQAIVASGAKTGVEVGLVDQQSVNAEGVTGLNDRSLLYGLLEQVAGNKGKEFVPIDLTALEQLAEKFGTSDVLFSSADYYRSYSEISAGVIAVSVLFFPALPFTLLIYVPVKLKKAQHMQTTVLEMDMLSGEINAVVVKERHVQPTKQRYDAIYTNIFKRLHEKPW